MEKKIEATFWARFEDENGNEEIHAVVFFSWDMEKEIEREKKLYEYVLEKKLFFKELIFDD